MSKKLTKKDYFNQLREIVSNEPELVKFIDRELELLAKKNASKGEKGETPTQKANKVLMEKIAEYMEVGKKYTCSDIEKAFDFSNQRTTSLLSKMVTNGEVVREVIKGRPHFSLKTEE